MMMIPRNSFGLNLFDEMFQDPFFHMQDSTSNFMKTDIQEKDGNYLIDMDLPGFQKENIKAELKNGYLTISAEKTEAKDEKDTAGNYIHRERYQGQCRRSFYVGDAVKEEDIKAGYKDGILHLVFPKKDMAQIEPQKKYIAIE